MLDSVGLLLLFGTAFCVACVIQEQFFLKAAFDIVLESLVSVVSVCHCFLHKARFSWKVR